MSFAVPICLVEAMHINLHNSSPVVTWDSLPPPVLYKILEKCDREVGHPARGRNSMVWQRLEITAQRRSRTNDHVGRSLSFFITPLN